MLKYLSAWSKVSPNKFKKNDKMYWLLAGLLLVLILYLLASHHASALKLHKQVLLNSHQYEDTLNVNLSHLNQLTNTKPKLRKLIHSIENKVGTVINKAYKLRQNAPTSMYTNADAKAADNQTQLPSQHKAFSGADINSRFANAHAATGIVVASRIDHPQYTIASGEFIHAVLETAINSDLPGMVRAVVSTPAYSYADEHVLVSAGSRLVGQYTSAIVRGQKRVMVIWNRLIRPDGISVQLNSPGTDALGRAGETANAVDTHFMARFGQATLLSLLGAGAASIGVANTDRYNSVAQYRSAISVSMQQAAKRSLQGSLSIKPTIRVYQGSKINVFVAHDLSLYDVLNQDYK
ncbi:MAG: TrbI/VirB10 family protein [Coxiellaceae bacterium]|nr:TrbI/VirB10 family protein [Coxiellaceae bacterium]